MKLSVSAQKLTNIFHSLAPRPYLRFDTVLVDKAEWLGHELWFGEVLEGDWWQLPGLADPHGLKQK